MSVLTSFRDRFERLKHRAGSFSGTLFRSTAPKYANSSDFLTGEGSRHVGGRWNPMGIATFYGSMSPEAAMAETLAHIRYYGLPPQSSMPRTFVAVEVEFCAVLDLTDGKIRQSLGVSVDRMTKADWRADMQSGRVPVTHALGQAAFDAGLEGLLVPSAATSGDTNLVCFVDNLRSSSRMEVVSPEDL